MSGTIWGLIPIKAESSSHINVSSFFLGNGLSSCRFQLVMRMMFSKYPKRGLSLGRVAYSDGFIFPLDGKVSRRDVVV